MWCLGLRVTNTRTRRAATLGKMVGRGIIVTILMVVASIFFGMIIVTWLMDIHFFETVFPVFWGFLFFFSPQIAAHVDACFSNEVIVDVDDNKAE